MGRRPLKRVGHPVRSAGRGRGLDGGLAVAHGALSPPDLGLSASVNGEATSQKGGSLEDKEEEKGQNVEEGLVGGFSEDQLHNE